MFGIKISSSKICNFCMSYDSGWLANIESMSKKIGVVKSRDYIPVSQNGTAYRLDNHRFGNFTYMKELAQDFSDCGLHNDKYTKYSPNKNCVNRA